ncbi:hypothetical protein AVEN_120490-1 [Araneus ventricosus]|uniref:Uncharacterized protein n=1 Tax=Araneus ventricosus TaxID=182803 RepID=A0A4Y2MPT0_ARAVE|nr:hypothetical protein AVEN_120490-1 [Araneus ventricosus]
MTRRDEISGVQPAAKQWRPPIGCDFWPGCTRDLQSPLHSAGPRLPDVRATWRQHPDRHRVGVALFLAHTRAGHSRPPRAKTDENWSGYPAYLRIPLWFGLRSLFIGSQRHVASLASE